jgi:hypothetical protein
MLGYDIASTEEYMPAILKMTGRAAEILVELERFQQRDALTETAVEQLHRLMIRWFIVAGSLFFLAILMGGDYFFTSTGLAIRLSTAGSAFISLIIALTYRKMDASTKREDVDNDTLVI